MISITNHSAISFAIRGQIQEVIPELATVIIQDSYISADDYPIGEVQT